MAPIKESVMLYMYCLIQSLAARRPFKSEAGVTAIEYGLIAALIAVAVITAVTTLGTNLTHTFTTVSGKLPSS
jgi:pilus assembly protein Flp/PilA